MSDNKCRLSIIIPVLNDAKHLERLLRQFSNYKNKDYELIVVDGGSTDNSLTIARKFNTLCLDSPKGRGIQMNAGVAKASGNFYWFVHADSLFDPSQLAIFLQQYQQYSWARFKVRFFANKGSMKLIAFMMNWRSCATSMVTGDHAMLVSKANFEAVQGFDELPLMEDLQISKKLKKIAKLNCLDFEVKTSERRWTKNGIWKTVLFMWWMRLRYYFGTDVNLLYRIYYS